MDQEQGLSQSKNLDEGLTLGNLTSPVQPFSESELDELNNFGNHKDAEISKAILDKDAISTYDFQPETYIIKDNYMLVGLKNNESICFVGGIKVSLLKGTASVANFQLKSSFNKKSPKSTKLKHYYIYSAKTYPILKIVADEVNLNFKNRFIGDFDVDETNDKSNLTNLIEELKNWDGLSKYDTVLRLESLNFTNFNKVSNIHPNYKNIFKLENEPLFQPIPGFYPVVKPTYGISSLNLDNYNTIIQDILNFKPDTESEFNVIAFGHKDQGKSTFLKILLNSLLNKYESIAYLNLDPGQTEFNPPGMLSLHLIKRPILGPNFTQLRQSYSCYYLGETTFKSSPSLAIKLIDQLFLDFKELKNNFPNSPLLINTSGWVQGQGLEILNHIASSISINFPVLIGDKSGIDISLEYLQIPSYKQDSFVASDKTAGVRRRNLMISSYLHLKVNTNFDVLPLRWDFSNFSLRPPLPIGWRNFELWLLHSPCKLSKVMFALNCALVAIYAPKDSFLTHYTTPTQSNGETTDNIGSNADIPKLVDINRFEYFDLTKYQYLGMALIRAIDIEQSKFHMLTPIPYTNLTNTAKGNLLMVKGDITLPEYHYYFDNCENLINNRQVLGLPKIKPDQFTLPYLTYKLGSKPGDLPRKDFAVKRTFNNR